MNKKKAEQLRRDAADGLESLATILDAQGLVRDSSSLHSASGQCRDDKPFGDLSWRYSFGILEFDLSRSRFRKIRPEGAEVLRLELSGTICGKFLDDDSDDDPLHELAIGIVVRGQVKDGSVYKPLACAWHLDRDENGDGVGEFCHPAYHFQSGGQKIWEISGFDYSSHLLLESPRNAHYPLDAVLAVDYVVSHFLGNPSWQTLRQDATYQRLLHESAEKFLKPYARSVAAAWNSVGLSSTWDGRLLWPSLL